MFKKYQQLIYDLVLCLAFCFCFHHNVRRTNGTERHANNSTRTHFSFAVFYYFSFCFSFFFFSFFIIELLNFSFCWAQKRTNYLRLVKSIFSRFELQKFENLFKRCASNIQVYAFEQLLKNFIIFLNKNIFESFTFCILF